MNVNQWIKDSDAAEALEYVNQNYEKWAFNAHMTRYGNLDRLSPENYHPYFTKIKDGEHFEDTEKRDDHHAMWLYSPRKSFIKFYVFLYCCKSN